MSKNNVVSSGQSKKRPWLACARMQTSADKKWKVRWGCVLCNHFRNSEKISVSPDGLTSTTAEKSSKQTKKSLPSISWGSFQIPVMLFKRRKTQGVQQHAKTRCHQRALMHWIDQAPSASKSSMRVRVTGRTTKRTVGQNFEGTAHGEKCALTKRPGLPWRPADVRAAAAKADGN